jgi:thiamine biosynthesis lipoprotein
MQTLRPPARRDLRAMNSDIELLSDAADAQRRFDRAGRWLRGFEARFSRFSPLSELSRLNAGAGRPFRASPGLFRLVAQAVELAQRSGGLFDPTLLRPLEALGYDRSFELLRPSRSGRAEAAPAGGWRDIVLDAATRSITLPPGCGVDLGGIGKGYAVDRLAALLGSPCLVNGGGDVYASGRPPDAGRWLVGIADPFHPERDLAVLALQDGAVATSSTLRRAWSLGDRRLHHLVDPRTGEASRSDAVQVSVVAPTCLLADYHAKVALLQGAAGGIDYLNAEPDAEGLILRTDGVLLESAGFGRLKAGA